LVLGPLSSSRFLLHRHLLTLERKALLLSGSRSLSLLLLLALGPSSTHGSVLALLLKINGP
jgi:hypothetical protein